MAYVIIGTFGACIWIILWALNIGGLDAALIGFGMIMALSALRNVYPHVTGRKGR